MYDEKTIHGIKEILIQHQHTVSVAESVTAGHLQAALASAESAAQFFQGGITAYNLGQKSRHLNIEPIHAERCNCVSEKVATQMAVQVTKLFTSDWGIAITGYAAPVPECDVDALFAFYAISFRDTVLDVKKISAKNGAPSSVQIFYVNTMLSDFLVLAKRHLQSSFSSSDLNSIKSKFASAGPFRTSPSIE